MISKFTTLLTLSATVLGASYTVANTVSIVTAPPGANGDICFTIHSASEGWTAVGLGNKMAGSDIYVGWKNSTGGYTISNRPGTGQTLPQHGANQQATRVDLIDTEVPSFAKISFSFCRKSSAIPPITATSSYIMAYGDTPPSEPDDPKSSFTFHTAFEIFATDLSPSGTAATGAASGVAYITSTPEVLKTVTGVHGALLWFAWSVAPLIAIFVARYGKDRLGHTWYLIHMGLLGGITFLFTIVGVILIILYRQPPHFASAIDPTEDIHVKMGLAISIAVFIQVALGFASNHFFDPNRSKVPIIDKAHWWLGRSLLVLGLINTWFGFKVYSTQNDLNIGFIVFFFVVIGLGFLSFAYAEVAVGQINHTEGASETNNSKQS